MIVLPGFVRFVARGLASRLRLKLRWVLVQGIGHGNVARGLASRLRLKRPPMCLYRVEMAQSLGDWLLA